MSSIFCPHCGGDDVFDMVASDLSGDARWVKEYGYSHFCKTCHTERGFDSSRVSEWALTVRNGKVVEPEKRPGAGPTWIGGHNGQISWFQGKQWMWDGVGKWMDADEKKDGIEDTTRSGSLFVGRPGEKITPMVGVVETVTVGEYIGAGELVEIGDDGKAYRFNAEAMEPAGARAGKTNREQDDTRSPRDEPRVLKTSPPTAKGWEQDETPRKRRFLPLCALAAAGVCIVMAVGYFGHYAGIVSRGDAYKTVFGLVTGVGSIVGWFKAFWGGAR